MINLNIGEINISHDGSYVTFECISSKHSSVSIIVQDEVGRSKRDLKFDLNKGKNEIRFDIANFSNGIYNAWIEVEGQTFIRAFEVLNKSRSTNSWLEKIFPFLG